jgi:DNA-binding beta-propeller fold protein YncE
MEWKVMRNRARGLLVVAVAGAVAIVALIGSRPARTETRPSLRLLSAIPLPDVRGRLDHLSLDVQHQRLFLAALGNDSVEVLDLPKSARTRSLPGLSNPQGVLYLPGPNRLHVANARDGSVLIFDGASLAALKSVPYSEDADNLRYDQATGHVWVGYGHALGELTADGARLADINLPEHPESFQIEQAGPRIFVNLPEAGTVAVVDRKSRKVVETWQTSFRGNFAMALDEGQHRLFVATRRPARLVILDTDNGRIVASMPTVGDCDDLFVEGRRGRVYVVGGEGAVAVIGTDGADRYRDIGRISTSPGARTGFFSPDLDRLYIAAPKHGSRPAEVREYSE